MYSWVRVQSRIKQTALKKHDFKMQLLARGKNYIYLATREKKNSYLWAILDFTSEGRICCGRCCVLCPGTPGVMAARPSAPWKSCLKRSVTNKERKRKERCLPLNEAKNGKRVWCRSGTQPAFSKWGRLNFPTSSLCATTFKTTGLSPSLWRALSLSSSSSEAREGLHPASINEYQPSRALMDHKKREMGEGCCSLFGSVGISSQIGIKTKYKNIHRIPRREFL